MSNTGGGFVDWLIGEGGAGWIIGVLTLGTWVVTFVRRKRASRIVVRETVRSSVVRVRPDMRALIAVQFDGKPVNTLGEVEVEITNEGSEVISDIVLDAGFTGDTKILRVTTVAPPKGPIARTDVALDWTDNHVFVRIPYLNSFREHSQGVRLSIMLDGDAQPMLINGGAAGWSVSHAPVSTENEELKRDLNAAVACAVAALLGLIYMSFFPAMVNLRDDDFTLHGLKVVAPVLVLFAVAAVMVVPRIWRSIRIRRRRRYL